MKQGRTRIFAGITQCCRAFGAAALSFILASALLLAGCGSSGEGSDSSGTAGASGASATPQATKVVIGTMVTEDILPMWVAEEEELFTEQGLDVTIETFQSAQELSTAVVSGAVDIVMTDIVVAANINASGTPVTMEWVTLGTTADQGRFGVMTSPESGIKSVEELAGKPVGVVSCTMLEYVIDNLLEEAGLSEDEIATEEIRKVPVRYEMMASNQVAAAALPGSLLSLGEATGMVLLADDSTGKNLSYSVMVVRNDLAQTASGIAMVEKLAGIWDTAVERINKNPESYRGLLVEKAQLPEIVKDSYKISTYPTVERPRQDLVDPILNWMHEKGYLESELTYDYKTGSFNS